MSRGAALVAELGLGELPPEALELRLDGERLELQPPRACFVALAKRASAEYLERARPGGGIAS